MRWGKNVNDLKWNTWHDYYAWHPIELGDGTVVWLETIERRGQPHHLSDKLEWYYRLKEPVAVTDKT